jgi:DNA-binding Lrp family transcriptional regulator
MVRAYVTIMTGAGTSRSVVERLREVQGVLKADIVAGEFDVVAEVETDSETGLLALVTDDIQSIDGVGRTSTCIVLS